MVMKIACLGIQITCEHCMMENVIRQEDKALKRSLISKTRCLPFITVCQEPLPSQTQPCMALRFGFTIVRKQLLNILFTLWFKQVVSTSNDSRDTRQAERKHRPQSSGYPDWHPRLSMRGAMLMYVTGNVSSQGDYSGTWSQRCSCCISFFLLPVPSQMHLYLFKKKVPSSLVCHSQH